MDQHGPRYTIALRAIEGLPLTRATYTISLRHFQALVSDVSAPSPNGSCTLASKKLGLHMSFWLCGRLTEAVVTGSAWQTPNGLRIGSSVSLLHRLFPHALNTQLVARPVNGEPRGSVDWDLASARQLGLYPVLVAFVKSRHIVALAIEIAGH